MRKEKKKKKYTQSIVAMCLVLVGIGVFFYPTVSNFLAERNQSKVIERYAETISSDVSVDLKKEWEKAEEYNENLAGDPVHDPFVPGSGFALPENYLEVLNLNGVMGYISIPKISVKLPIYHGTSEEVMQKGVGHIESTALPIGGDSRHCVMTGHRGLPSAELFTRLDELEVGDVFYVYILDKTLMYKVDQIKTILPDALESLQVIHGKDLVTLVTCTPYGVNTHRLLVRAERVTDMFIEETKAKETIQTKHLIQNPMMIGSLIGIGILFTILFVRKLQHKRPKGRRYSEKK